MENYESVMRGTKFGAVIVAGSSVSSILVLLVEHRTDPSIHMPRSTKQVPTNDPFLLRWKEPVPLPSEEIKLIKTWIDQGAKNS